MLFFKAHRGRQGFLSTQKVWVFNVRFDNDILQNGMHFHNSAFIDL